MRVHACSRVLVRAPHHVGQPAVRRPLLHDLWAFRTTIGKIPPSFPHPWDSCAMVNIWQAQVAWKILLPKLDWCLGCCLLTGRPSPEPPAIRHAGPWWVAFVPAPCRRRLAFAAAGAAAASKQPLGLHQGGNKSPLVTSMFRQLRILPKQSSPEAFVRQWRLPR